jgi:plastocyanin
MTGKNVLLLTGVILSLLFGPREGGTETVEVKIIKSTFIPAVLKIKKGDTVRWVNTEELLHAIASGKAPMPDKRFHAAYVKKEFEVTLDKPGFYDYFCELHQAIMRGVVIVEDTD